MTGQTGPDLNKGRAAAALTLPARRFHRAVLATFAETGQAPGLGGLTDIARTVSVDPAAALAELGERDLIALGPGGEIRAAYPFSPAPTGIRVSWPGGPTAYAMCAIDALGISAMLGRPVRITAAEPGTGRIITIDTDRDQGRWDPPGAVVFAGATDGDCCPSADRTCGYINFFTTAGAARKWAARHPAITGAVLSQAQALAWGIAEFGAFMRTGDEASQL